MYNSDHIPQVEKESLSFSAGWSRKKRRSGRQGQHPCLVEAERGVIGKGKHVGGQKGPAPPCSLLGTISKMAVYKLHKGAHCSAASLCVLFKIKRKTQVRISSLLTKCTHSQAKHTPLCCILPPTLRSKTFYVQDHKAKRNSASVVQTHMGPFILKQHSRALMDYPIHFHSNRLCS